MKMLKKYYPKIKKLTLAETQKRDDFLIKYLNFIPYKVKPNYITTIRFLLSWFFIFPQTIGPVLALSIATGAALTDLIDGVLARKRNQITNFGKIFDHTSDKFLVAGIIYYLFYNNLISKKIIFHILLPESIILIYGIWFLKNRWAKIPEPNVLLRIKFVFYCIGLTLLLIANIANKNLFLFSFATVLIVLGIILSWAGNAFAYQEVLEKIKIHNNKKIKK